MSDTCFGGCYVEEKKSVERVVTSRIFSPDRLTKNSSIFGTKVRVWLERVSHSHLNNGDLSASPNYIFDNDVMDNELV